MTKKRMVCLFSWVLLSGALPATADTWAVVVGIDNYQKESVTSLRFAGADAHLFSDTLEAIGVQPDHIFLYGSDSPPDRRPTRANLVLRLEQLQASIGPKDSLIFFFAGHGINVDNNTFLMTEEADPRSLGTLKITSLDGRQLVGLLDKANASNSLMILDACRNDPSRGRGDQDNRLDDTAMANLTPSAPVAAQEKNRATLFACSTGERSYEAEEIKHGYFTYWLTQGIKKAAAPDGKVTLQTMYSFVQKEVPQATQRDLGKSQVPVLRYEGPNPNGWVFTQIKPLRPVGKPYKVGPAKGGVANAELTARNHRLEVEKAALLAEQQRAQRENARLVTLVGALGGLDTLRLSAVSAKPEASALGRARAMILDSNYAQANAELSATLKNQSENYPARLLRGVSRLHAGDARGAIDDLNSAIRQDPNFWPAYWFRAQAREQARDAAGAQTDYGRIIELNPRSARAYRSRAQLRTAAGDSAGANEDRKKAEKIEMEVHS